MTSSVHAWAASAEGVPAASSIPHAEDGTGTETGAPGAAGAWGRRGGPGDDLGGGEAGGGGKGGRRELRHDRCRARLGLVSKRENPKTDRTTQHTAAADENFGQSKSGIQPFISSSFYKICPFLGAFAIRLSILLSSPSNLKFADDGYTRSAYIYHTVCTWVHTRCVKPWPSQREVQSGEEETRPR